MTDKSPFAPLKEPPITTDPGPIAEFAAPETMLPLPAAQLPPLS